MNASNKKNHILAGLLIAIFLCLPVYLINAAEVTIDPTIDTAVTSHNGSSPTVVFISNQVGYSFYRDSTGACAYSKTTNGGDVWGTAVTVDAQTDCFKIALWYDRWTPGDTTGTFIHIVTMDSADLWYTRLNTTGDVLTATLNASGANQTGGFAVGANIPSITKGTDGDLYMGVQDTADSFVIKCPTGADCTQIANWTEAGTNPFDLAPDWLILMPLSGGNILAIRSDVSADDVQSKVYTDSTNTWSVSWTTIDANVIEDGAYDGHFGATLSKSTSDIYLAYVADVGTFGTDDDIRTAVYSSGVWTTKTNVLTNDAKGITGAKIAFDENTNEIYAVYTARTTPGGAATGNVYWKKSGDGMTSWGVEQGPINTVAGDIYGARVNIMSNERIYITWDLTSADDLLGNTIVDFAFPPPPTPPTPMPILGGGPVLSRKVTFLGKAFPDAKIFIVDKDVIFEKIISQNIIANTNGVFNISFSDISYSQHSFGLIIKDKEGRATQTKFFNIDTTVDDLVIKDIFVSPTIDLKERLLTKGNNLIVAGYATPGNVINIEIDNVDKKEGDVEKDGSYKMTIDTSLLDLGTHSIRVKQIDPIEKRESDYSLINTFIVSLGFIPTTDLNNDGVVNIQDWSMFLLDWGLKNENQKEKIDFNGDKKVDINDFSIFISTIKK